MCMNALKLPSTNNFAWGKIKFQATRVSVNAQADIFTTAK